MGRLDLPAFFVLSSYDSADVGLMLYYYHTRRRQLDRTSYQKGMTGYRGILHELVVDVPTRATEWLLRK
jgi:hypothetical protein